MGWLTHFLESYPELAVFLAVGVGYILGDIRIAGFAFGPVTGSLLAGLAIGQFAEVPISGMAKSFLFLLFLFGIGYSVGPQFLQALQRDGLRSLLLALVCTTTGLASAYVVSRFLGLDPGYSAGLLSGGLTQSAAMGTATEAVNRLAIAEEQRALYVAHIAVADAVCYIFGIVGAIWFCSVGAPKLLGADIVADAKAIEAELGLDQGSQGVLSGYHTFELRAFLVPPGAAIIGLTVGEAERLHATDRFYIQRIRRGKAIMPATLDLVLEADDVIAISGRRKALVEKFSERHAEEVDDDDLLDMPVKAVDVLLSERDMDGVTVGKIAQQDWTRGIYLRTLRRGTQELPIARGVKLSRGDVLTLVGPEDVIDAAAPRFGPVIAPTTSTDFVVLGLAIFVGGLVGVLARITIGGAVIALGTSVGALIAGLVVGHLRTRHPLFGRIPDGAVSLMTALGLASFVAMTGLHAGPVFIDAIREVGIGLFLGGIAVTMVPLLIGLAFGRFVLGMKSVLLLGALAGSLTMTAAMGAVQQRSGSPVAVLGYTPAYPISNILLTLWGTVIVILTAG
ncbi:aspartate-alanine antiporter [Cereibacter sphaeroides]|uniref:aspartate-alanine antiporter n=1 Tax=Cereibacter sphaeroides TaxID=1063 RepID=UPI001F3F2E3A|nr:aspartate-alanine antiporter [Cereibacter sphaeroides]MCE6951464.1 aspartate-alanine antiporter [Cereibacter sphaeroides]